MYILLTFFILLNLFFSFIDYIVVGDADYYVAQLTATMTDNTTTANVTTTAGYRLSDYVWIGDEEIKYNGKTSVSFLSLTRGYDGTEAVSHTMGSHVYGRTAGGINAGVGFNIVDMGASVGNVHATTYLRRMISDLLPNMVQWNFYWMKEGFWQYLRLICVAISYGLVFVIIIQILGALGGLLQSAFNR